MIDIKLRRNSKYMQLNIEAFDWLLDKAQMLEVRKDLAEAIEDIDQNIEFIDRFYTEDKK